MPPIEFDPAKDAANQAKHDMHLSRAEQGDWPTAYIERDDRRDYGEARFFAYLVIGGRVHVVVFIPRADLFRVISLRRANEREVRRYERLRGL